MPGYELPSSYIPKREAAESRHGGDIMAKEKAISDEQIVAALLAAGTIREAAGAVGLSERALYDRMRGAEFDILYRGAKSDLLRSAVIDINKHLQEAIEVIAEIMADRGNNPAIRLQAAQTIINNAAKLSQRLQEAEGIILNNDQCNRIIGAYRTLEKTEDT